jgi:hypothetical protein
MAITMSITDRTTGASEQVPVCTSGLFVKFWLPAAKELGLERIGMLSACWIEGEDRDGLLREMASLDRWAESHLGEDVYFEEMRRRISTLSERLRSVPLERCEVVFG